MENLGEGKQFSLKLVALQIKQKVVNFRKFFTPNFWYVTLLLVQEVGASKISGPGSYPGHYRSQPKQGRRTSPKYADPKLSHSVSKTKPSATYMYARIKFHIIHIVTS
jgi:hypothetical protein